MVDTEQMATNWNILSCGVTLAHAMSRLTVLCGFSVAVLTSIKISSVSRVSQAIFA